MMAVGTILIHLTALGSLLFVLAYGLTTPWFRSALGRSLMATAFSLLLIFGLSSITLMFGTHWPHRNEIRAIVAAIACFSVWSNMTLLTAAQIRNRRNPDVEHVR